MPTDSSAAAIICCRVKVMGLVQGVGFRPYVYHLAGKFSLAGWVANSPQGLELELEGPAGAVRALVAELSSAPPQLAEIIAITTEQLPLCGYVNFVVRPSSFGGKQEAFVPPDLAICPQCRQEMLSPGNRRYRYPFTCCTYCGPRFTIIEALPYDRQRTAMQGFDMCPACRREYEDPADRRFHSQPNACPQCGPQAALVDGHGNELPGDWSTQFQRLVRAGEIMAVKGLGGFHLACDASSIAAINELRRRKHRPARPLAVMARDLDTARRYCRVSEQEEQWLTAPGAPIVILNRLPGCNLPRELAPGLNTLGVMLPYTPLHQLLFDQELDLLVMTSGNRRGLPLIKDNDQALAWLERVADYFVLHNRPILQGCDDSLLRVNGGRLHWFRRARGFTPRPLLAPAAGGDCIVLGTGAEWKNSFCLLQDRMAWMSQYLGSMDTREGLTYFQSTLERMQRLLGMDPQVVAYDLHPGYQVAALARQLPARIYVPVQHHHAHLAACMADNGLDDQVVGVICDGTGYGTDGAIWGCEILTGGYLGFERSFHLAYLPLPGGEEAIRHNWRAGAAYLAHYLGDDGLALALDLWPGRSAEINIMVKMLRLRFNTPRTSSCGRLFDAVASLLGVCQENTYEGQAAIELGELVDRSCQTSYPWRIDGIQLDPAPMLAGIVDDLRAGAEPVEVATRFHNTLADMLVTAAARAGKKAGLHQVVLSGGTFHNSYLLELVTRGLEQEGLAVFCHRNLPPDDGGIALGQAMIAARQCRQKGDEAPCAWQYQLKS